MNNEDIFIKNKEDIIGDFLVKNLNDSIVSINNDIAYFNRVIDRAQVTIRNNKLSVKEYSLKIKKINKDIENVSNLKAEIKKTLSIPLIEDVDIYKDYLCFYTKEIYFKNKKVLAGKFKIAINFTNKTIQFFNLSHVVNGYQHPHIAPEGIPCMGNMAASITQCIIEKKIYALILLSIAYLQSYTNKKPDRPYVFFTDWIKNSAKSIIDSRLDKKLIGASYL